MPGGRQRGWQRRQDNTTPTRGIHDERQGCAIRAAALLLHAGPRAAELPKLPHVLNDGGLRRHTQVELRAREGRRLDDDHGCRRRSRRFLTVHENFGGRQQFVDGSIADRLSLVVPADRITSAPTGLSCARLPWE